MSSSLSALNKFELGNAEGLGAGVLRFAPGKVGVQRLPSALSKALGDFRYDNNQQDRRISDYLLLGLLSIAVHSTVVDNFNAIEFEPAIVEAVKPESKVQITLSRPQPPKPVPPPPPLVKPKPPVQKLVPLKPPPKPVKKIIEAPPVIESAPIVDSAPVNAPTAPVSAPAPVIEEKITAPTAGADYLHNPPPEYPELAQERGWEGKVLLKVHVQPSGKPDSISIAKSSGQQVLDDAAVKTVYKWSFVPAKRGETPIAGYVTVPITFNLS